MGTTRKRRRRERRWERISFSICVCLKCHAFRRVVWPWTRRRWSNVQWHTMLRSASTRIGSSDAVHLFSFQTFVLITERANPRPSLRWMMKRSCAIWRRGLFLCCLLFSFAERERCEHRCRVSGGSFNVASLYNHHADREHRGWTYKVSGSRLCCASVACYYRLHFDCLR
jgi:hypothetical protein